MGFTSNALDNLCGLVDAFPDVPLDTLALAFQQCNQNADLLACALLKDVKSSQATPDTRLLVNDSWPSLEEATEPTWTLCQVPPSDDSSWQVVDDREEWVEIVDGKEENTILIDVMDKSETQNESHSWAAIAAAAQTKVCNKQAHVRRSPLKARRRGTQGKTSDAEEEEEDDNMNLYDFVHRKSDFRRKSCQVRQ